MQYLEPIKCTMYIGFKDDDDNDGGRMVVIGMVVPVGKDNNNGDM